MECILIFLLCSVSLSYQYPWGNGFRKQTGDDHESNQEIAKAVRDKKFYCPFAHPSLRNIPERVPLVNTPFVPISDLFKRSLNLKSLYVDQIEGVVSYPGNESRIRVDATEHVSDYALSLAAETIRRMTKYMSARIFKRCAENTLVGVFTKAESMTVYPEYSDVAPPPGCGISCEGTCKSQCSDDGRPYASLAGAGGQRAVILDDNVLCNDEDPYLKGENVLVHEYAHTIKLYGLPEDLQNLVGCEGTCKSQCSDDGRPYASLAGAGGQRAVILDDNVLCNDEDPYLKGENVLVHEYAHTIKLYGLPEDLQNLITSAYENAKATETWTTTDYAMSNEDEYWAVASSSLFNSDRFLTGAAGMNVCGDEVCQSEDEASVHIYDKDPSLYNLLMEVYYNSNVSNYAGLKPCTKLSY